MPSMVVESKATPTTLSIRANGITMARFDVLTALGHFQHMLQLQGMSVLGPGCVNM